MRPSSKFCAGPAATSNSTSTARPIRKPQTSTPGVCGGKPGGSSTNRSGPGAAKQPRAPKKIARPAPVHPPPPAVRAAGARKRKKMSSSITETSPQAAQPATFTAAVITVSDSCSRGQRKDLSGPAVFEALKKSGFSVVATHIVQDDSMQIQNALVHLALEVRLIVTTGGTGIAPRDVTPEATQAICDRLIDGVG